MAQKIVTTLTDDLDGSDATTTVTFGLQGVTYEIDLSDVNRDAVFARFADLVTAGRKIGRTKTPAQSRDHKPRDRSAENSEGTAIRAWARSNGWPGLGDRGRIPGEATAAYRAAHA